jgi:hypothetical protein
LQLSQAQVVVEAVRKMVADLAEHLVVLAVVNLLELHPLVLELLTKDLPVV